MTTPQLVAMVDVQKVINMFGDQHIGIPVLGIIENMSWFSPSKHPDEKYFLFGSGGGEALAKSLNIPLLVQIPINEIICSACDEGKLMEMFKVESVKVAYELLVKKISN